MFVDGNGNRPLQEVDRHNELTRACVASQDAFDTCKRAVFNADALTGSEIWRRASASFEGAANVRDLLIRYGCGDSARADDVLNCATADHGKFLRRIEPAKQITWEGHVFDNLDAIRVAPPFWICRAEWFVASVPQYLDS